MNSENEEMRPLLTGWRLVTNTVRDFEAVPRRVLWAAPRPRNTPTTGAFDLLNGANEARGARKIQT